MKIQDLQEHLLLKSLKISQSWKTGPDNLPQEALKTNLPVNQIDRLSLTEKSIEKFYYRFYILSLLSPTIAERFLLNSAKSKMEKKKLKTKSIKIISHKTG